MSHSLVHEVHRTQQRSRHLQLHRVRRWMRYTAHSSALATCSCIECAAGWGTPHTAALSPPAAVSSAPLDEVHRTQQRSRHPQLYRVRRWMRYTAHSSALATCSYIECAAGWRTPHTAALSPPAVISSAPLRIQSATVAIFCYLRRHCFCDMSSLATLLLLLGAKFNSNHCCVRYA